MFLPRTRIPTDGRIINSISLFLLRISFISKCRVAFTVCSNRHSTIGNPHCISLICWQVSCQYFAGRCHVPHGRKMRGLWRASAMQCVGPHAQECQYEHSVRACVREVGFVQYVPHPFSHENAQHIINMRPLVIVFGRLRSPSHSLTLILCE